MAALVSWTGQKIVDNVRRRFSRAMLTSVTNFGRFVSNDEDKMRDYLNKGYNDNEYLNKGDKEYKRGAYLNKTKNKLENSIYFIHLDYINRNDETTILYSHGNGNWLYSSNRYTDHVCKKIGCNSLIYDYSGYGISTDHHKKNPKFKHLLAEQVFAIDIECVFDYLVNECKIPYKKIFLCGNHVGTSPTIDLCIKLEKNNIEIGGIILERTTPSAFRMQCSLDRFNKINEYFDTDIIDVINNYNKIENIKTTPILFIQDKYDWMIPFQYVLEMYEKVNKVNKNVAEPLWVEKSLDSELFWELIPDDEPGGELVTKRNSYYFALQAFVSKHSS